MLEQKNVRNSSVELLKLFALFSIVVSHVVLTLSTGVDTYIQNSEYIMDLSHATYSVKELISIMLRYGGEFGNTVFFICSAWFFLDGGHFRKKKIIYMLADVWVISVLILAIVLIFDGTRVNRVLILRSLFPTIFNNNWYITCYIIFYIIHPILNKIVFSLKQKVLLRLNILASVMYFGVAFVGCLSLYLFGVESNFFFSRLIIWIVVYFMLAYIKRYSSKAFDNRKYILGLILFGSIGNCLLIIATNLIGLRVEAFSNALQIWIVPYNPFIMALGFGLLGFARRIYCENKAIDYVSGLSLLIYILHENIILRLLYRPLVWQYIYNQFGYDHILGWILLFSAVVFLFALICSICYFESLRKLIQKACDSIYQRLRIVWNGLERRLLNIK